MADILDVEKNRKKANKGCYKCPSCGEDKLCFEVGGGGIMMTLPILWKDGKYRMKADTYKCFSCGTRWESKPYQWR